MYEKGFKSPNFKIMTLDKLMTKLSKGDQSVFESIYSQTSKIVYYIALSILKDRSLAEDAMQSVYLNVLKYAKQYRAGTNASAWISRIARNESLNLKKKYSFEQSVDESENLHMFGTSTTDDYGLLTDLARWILPEDEFQILLLVAVEGYKRKELAEMLDMPISTVTWKYNNAIDKMKKVLNGQEG